MKNTRNFTEETINSNNCLTPYSLTQRVMDKHHLLLDGGVLYAFNGEHYIAASKADIISMTKALLSPKALQQIKLKDLEETAEFLLSEPELHRKYIKPERGAVLFNNGLFDIRTGKEIDHSPDRLCLYKVHADYGRDEDTPVFDEYLETISGGSYTIKRRIIEVLGYCLLPELDAKSLFVFTSTDGNGKTVLTELLKMLLSEEAVSYVSPYDARSYFNVAPIIGKHLNLVEGLPGIKLKKDDVSFIKSLINGDRITVEESGKDPFAYMNTAKMVITTNKGLRCKLYDWAFWRCMVIIPCERTWLEGYEDEELLDKLWRERNGIVYKAMQAATTLINNNYFFSDCPLADKKKEKWMSLKKKN